MIRISLVLLFSFISACTISTKETKRNESTVLSPKAELGRYLFFDTRLSLNNTKSCGSCHDPKFAFSDGYRRSVTATGDIVLHNAPSLMNAALMKRYDWSSPDILTLEHQHVRPLFGINPVELGVKNREATILKKLMTDRSYQLMFGRAFPRKQLEADWSDIISCLAEYVRSLSSFNAPYDLYMRGDSAALSHSAMHGRKLFFSERLLCSSCHVPPSFSLATQIATQDSIYINIGLYNVKGRNKYPVEDQGLQTYSKRVEDNGKFRIPTLRNVALTAPYFHDGSVGSLEEVVDIYAAGGRKIYAGPLEGNGIHNRNKDPRIHGFSLTADEKGALIDFLYALTDSTISKNPGFRNPFGQGERD